MTRLILLAAIGAVTVLTVTAFLIGTVMVLAAVNRDGLDVEVGDGDE